MVTIARPGSGNHAPITAARTMPIPVLRVENISASDDLVDGVVLGVANGPQPTDAVELGYRRLWKRFFDAWLEAREVRTPLGRLRRQPIVDDDELDAGVPQLGHDLGS